jgi:hypothetical protein
MDIGTPPIYVINPGDAMAFTDWPGALPTEKPFLH